MKKIEINFGVMKLNMVKEGAKSKKFKLLPKKAEDLTVSEIYFLIDYLTKVIPK